MLGIYKKQLMCEKSRYAKAIGYRVKTLDKIIRKWKSHSRKIEVETPDHVYVILSTILKAIAHVETMTTLNKKVERHSKFLHSLPLNSPFMLACIYENDWKNQSQFQ